MYTSPVFRMLKILSMGDNIMIIVEGFSLDLGYSKVKLEVFIRTFVSDLCFVDIYMVVAALKEKGRWKIRWRVLYPPLSGGDRNRRESRYQGLQEEVEGAVGEPLVGEVRR